MSGSSSPALASVALLDVSQAATASSSKGNAVLAQSIMDEAVSASAGPALSSAGLLVMVAQAAQSLSLLLATAGGSLYLESVGMSGLSSLTASAINAVSTSIAEALLSGLSLSSQADIVAQNVASSSPALGAAGKLQMNAAVSTPSVSDLAAGAKTITTVSITGSVAALLAMSSTVTAGGTTYAGSIASSSTSSAAAAAVLEAIGQAANSTLVGLDPSSQADLSILVTFQTGGRLDASGVVDTLAAVSDALQADLAVATISAHGAVIAGEVTRFDLLSPGTASSWRSLDASPMTEFARLDAGPVRSYR